MFAYSYDFGWKFYLLFIKKHIMVVYPAIRIEPGGGIGSCIPGVYFSFKVIVMAAHSHQIRKLFHLFKMVAQVCGVDFAAKGTSALNNKMTFIFYFHEQ